MATTAMVMTTTAAVATGSPFLRLALPLPPQGAAPLYRYGLRQSLLRRPLLPPQLARRCHGRPPRSPRRQRLRQWHRRPRCRRLRQWCRRPRSRRLGQWCRRPHCRRRRPPRRQAPGPPSMMCPSVSSGPKMASSRLLLRCCQGWHRAPGSRCGCQPADTPQPSRGQARRRGPCSSSRSPRAAAVARRRKARSRRLRVSLQQRTSQLHLRGASHDAQELTRRVAHAAHAGDKCIYDCRWRDRYVTGECRFWPGGLVGEVSGAAGWALDPRVDRMWS
mmetsp:Transcript_81832/g.245366  ORF Transcript_81832/g.245366 Transcript_81832/m.245366 type:complete len:276 (-) Transcript_81832:41-868(-)